MKDKLLALAAKLWMPTVVRHVITAAAGYVSATGIDGSTTTGLIAGGVMYGASVIWSLVSKRFGPLLEKWGMADIQSYDAESAQYGKQLAVMVLGAVTSQLVSALSGYLLAAGYAGDINDPMAVGIWLANLGLSKARGPSRAQAQAAIKTLMLLACVGTQMSCAFSVVPLPGQTRPMMLVNTDIEGLDATADHVSITRLSATEPINAQAEAGRTWLGIWGNTKIAVKGLDAATSLGSTVSDALTK